MILSRISASAAGSSNRTKRWLASERKPTKMMRRRGNTPAIGLSESPRTPNQTHENSPRLYCRRGTQVSVVVLLWAIRRKVCEVAGNFTILYTPEQLARFQTRTPRVACSRRRGASKPLPQVFECNLVTFRCGPVGLLSTFVDEILTAVIFTGGWNTL